MSLQVCDQPHPLLVAQIVKDCARCKLDEAYKGMKVRFSRYHICIWCTLKALGAVLHCYMQQSWKQVEECLWRS